MSYTCAVTKKVVVGEPQVLVPTLKRRVKYQKYFDKVDKKAGSVTKVYFGDYFHGWETVKEEPTTKERATELLLDTENNFVGDDKVVGIKVTYKDYQKFMERHNIDENVVGSYMS